MRRRILLVAAAVVLVAVLAAAGCTDDDSGTSPPPTTTEPVAHVADVATDDLAASLCSAAGGGSVVEPVVTLDDVDGDGTEDAVVSTSCGEGELAANGVFVDGPGEPTLVGHFRGDDLAVYTGAGVTLAAVTPVLGPDGAATGLVDRLVYVVEDGELVVAERRQMTDDEYRASYAPVGTRVGRGDVVADWQTGVALIEPITCYGSGAHGSGFLLSDELVMTNGHVVADAVALRVEVAGRVLEGKVIGLDAVRDLALVRLAEKVDGHVFELASDPPRIGVDATALGYPLVRQFSAARGEISGVGRRLEIEDSFYEDAIQTSAPINPGNSGGPLVSDDGEVFGINSAGRFDADNIGLAIPAAHVQEAFLAWRGHGPLDVAPSADCYTGNDIIASWIVDLNLPPVIDSLTTYIVGINWENYREAWDVNANSVGGTEESFRRFRDGLLTSIIEDYRIIDIVPVGSLDDRTVEVDVVFRSFQDPAYGRNGQACTDWYMRYAMAQHPDGVWRIESSTPQEEPTECPDDGSFG